MHVHVHGRRHNAVCMATCAWAPTQTHCRLAVAGCAGEPSLVGILSGLLFCFPAFKAFMKFAAAAAAATATVSVICRACASVGCVLGSHALACRRSLFRGGALTPVVGTLHGVAKSVCDDVCIDQAVQIVQQVLKECLRQPTHEIVGTKVPDCNYKATHATNNLNNHYITQHCAF